MAKISNPAKEFQFNIVIPGMNPFLCQKVTSPDYEFEVAEHGDTDRDIKTAGRVKIGMFKVEKLFNATVVDNTITNWHNQIRSGATPDVYKRAVLIEQYAPDGITVVNRWVCEDAWPQKRNGVDFSRVGSNNTMETVEFCCDDLVFQ